MATPTLEFSTVHPEDLVCVIKRVLESETSRSFTLSESYKYDSAPLDIKTTNSLLIEFKTLKDSFPELYPSATYRMLLVLGELERNDFPTSWINQVRKLRSKDNVKKVILVLWSHPDTDTSEALKAGGITVVTAEPPSQQQLQNRALRDFIPIPGRSAEYSLKVGHVSGHLIDRLRKLFHLVLSEIAAPIYDKHYAAGRVATSAVMEFEKDRLNEIVRLLKKEGQTAIAVDVGCGTGRHSLLIARHFQKVFAFDFSQAMVAAAQQNKESANLTNIFLSESDFEHETLADEGLFYGKCDLIVASFGMCSFVNDTAKMLRRFDTWLRPGGRLFLSFYNENSIVLRLKPNWRDTSLATNINTTDQSLRVTLPTGASFDIFCKTYNDGIRGVVNRIVDIDRIYSYPTTMALLPNSLLQDKLAQLWFDYIDATLASDPRVDYGHYVMICAHKKREGVGAFDRALKMLNKQAEGEFEVLSHRPVVSMKDAREALGGNIAPEVMIKTIIFKNTESGRYIVVSLPANKRVNEKRVEELLSSEGGQVRLKTASEDEIRSLGFPLGGVAPIGFPDEEHIDLLVHDSIASTDAEWLYTGIGDNTKSLKIRKGALLGLISGYKLLHHE